VNQGLIKADAADQALELKTSSLTHEGTALATQGGILRIDGHVWSVQGDGEWVADGGRIQVRAFEMNTGGPILIRNSGELDVRDSRMAGSDLTADSTGKLTLGYPAVLRLSGDFSFAMTSESDWNWDGASLAMTGGIGDSEDADWASVEVGGQDLGTDPINHVGDPSGFANSNFYIPILNIGPGAHVRLVDLIDNGNRNGPFGQAEALYVQELRFEDSTGALDVNGLHLYYMQTNAGPDQIIEMDTTPPTVECPSPQSLSLGIGCEASMPDITALVIASDNFTASENLVITQDPPAGTTSGPGDVSIVVTVTDEAGNSNTCTSTLTLTDDTPPSITSLDGSPLLIPINNNVDFVAEYLDNCGVESVTWDFGDGNGPQPGGVSVTHVYMGIGIQTVTLTVADAAGNTSSEEIVVVVYDPAAGFTTGGGWFVPDSESFVDGVPVTDTISKANFGFVVKYKKGADNPDGNLEFQYKAGDIDLKSSNMEWLVVQSATKVRFKGKATINGEGEYTFKVTAEDNGELGTEDTFQIEIWMGVVDTENAPPVPKHKAKGTLGGGNILIHQK
jgi:PKD repeat protein